MQVKKLDYFLNDFMFRTGLKAKIQSTVNPNDFFVELYVTQLNVLALRSIDGFITKTFSENGKFTELLPKVQIQDGSLGIRLSYKLIDEKY